MRGPSIRPDRDKAQTERLTVAIEQPFCGRLRQIARRRGIGVGPLVREMVVKQLAEQDDNPCLARESDSIAC